MATPVYDKQGKRITTDVLSAGYIRQEMEEKDRLSMPAEIKKQCFEYWLIDRMVSS